MGKNTTTKETPMTTTHLIKTGNAYATADLRFRVYRRDGWWRLHAADKYGFSTVMFLSKNKAEALAEAERVIASRINEEALPLDRTVQRPKEMWGEKFHKSGADASDWSDYEPCQCCGRKVGKNPLYAIVVGGGSSLCLPADAAEFEKHDGGWMGCYPIGSECAKMFPAGYLTTLPVATR